MKMSPAGKMMLATMGFIGLALLNGCARLPPPDATNPIEKIAVLPIENVTSDMDGPAWVREAFSDMIVTRYYKIIPNSEIDQLLRDKMGVTLGGQLDYANPATGAPSPVIVGQNLGVDGLIYCRLEDFQNLITGFYNRKKVKAKCSLVNAKTEKVVWEKEEEESHSDFSLSVSGAIDAAKQKLVGAVINSALRSNPLKLETAAVVEKMKKTIPSGPVQTEN